jgi:hypothetical protein
MSAADPADEGARSEAVLAEAVLAEADELMRLTAARSLTVQHHPVRESAVAQRRDRLRERAVPALK